MNNWKEHQVVLLSTNKGSKIVKHIHMDINTIHYRFANDLYLYMLSNEEIKDGEFSYNEDINVISKKYKGTHRIIASTNPELNLSKPTDEFLQEYILRKNQNIPIDSVLVEYEDKGGKRQDSIDGMWISDWKLKISSDNTINCKLV